MIAIRKAGRGFEEQIWKDTRAQNNALCSYMWSRTVSRDPVVLLGSQEMKEAINGDKDTTSVKSWFCFKLVR